MPQTPAIFSKTIALEMTPCFGQRTGVGIYTHELVKTLTLRCSEFRLIAQFYTGFPSFTQELSVDFPIETDVCPYFAYGVYRRIWRYAAIPYDFLFRKKADIYHFFNYVVPPRISGKVITTIHDIAYELYPQTMLPARQKRLKKDIQLSVDRADAIVAVSEFTKKMLMERLYIPQNKIRVVSPGVYCEQFSQQFSAEVRVEIKKRYNLPENYILFMGTLEPRKNIEIIIKAYKVFFEENKGLAGDVKLVIAGKKGWLYESIFELANSMDLGDQIIFTDYVHDNDKAVMYQMASLFLFPSLYEGFGIPVIEAMAAGVPVITSDNSSLPEVGGKAAILVNCMDYERIAFEIQRILCDKTMAQTMIVKGQSQSQQFSWSKSADKIINLYNEL